MIKKYTIIKKIAKLGNNSIIIIPKMLQNRLGHGKMVQVEITEIHDITKTSEEI